MKLLLILWAMVTMGCSSSMSDVTDATLLDASVDAPIPDAMADPLPAMLSETGLYAEGSTTTLGTGVREYNVNYPLWSDNAEKRRFILLPAGTQIKATNVDFWKFPKGTKVWKEFALGGQRLETRFLVKAGPFAQDWEMVSYLWDQNESDAVQSPMGADNVLGTEHDVPGSDDCRRCHRHQPDIVIGVGGIQLNHDEAGLNLSALIAEGLITEEVDSVSFEIPGDETAKAALGYLHGNCGTCHHDTSDVQESIKMRLFLTSESLTSVVDTTIYKTAVAMPLSLPLNGATSLIEPGSPSQSALSIRTGQRGDGQMPPLGTEIVDAGAQAQIEAWILSLQ